MLPTRVSLPAKASLALSIREKFRVPVGCDLFIVVQKGHVKVDTVLRASWGRIEQCISGTTLWWKAADMFSNRGVPLMYKVDVSKVQLVDHLFVSASEETT